MKKKLICFALAFVTSITFADEDDDSKVDELVQELFLSEIVYPQDANELQLTTGVQWFEEDSETFFITPLVIEYGITDNFQVGVTFPSQYGGNVGDSGIGNIELESLYNFYNNKDSGLAFSAAFGVSFPSLSDEVGEKGVVFEPVLIAYKSLGNVGLNLSIGAEVPTETEEEIGIELGAAIIYNAGMVRPSLEFSAEFEDGEAAYSLLAGATILLGDEFELGLGVAKGLNNEAAEWQALSNLTWEFEF